MRCAKKPTPELQALFYEMLEIEREENVPPQYYGMTLAKACFETAGYYNRYARGDCKSRNPKRGCRALGFMQFWKWAIPGLNRLGKYQSKRDPRTDPKLSARYLVRHIQSISRGTNDGVSLKELCPRLRTAEQKWIGAWLWVNRGPFWRYKTVNGVRRDVRKQNIPRCKDAPPKGYKVLQRWMKRINSNTNSQ
jgi:hypothetical protein